MYFMRSHRHVFFSSHSLSIMLVIGIENKRARSILKCYSYFTITSGENEKRTRKTTTKTAQSNIGLPKSIHIYARMKYTRVCTVRTTSRMLALPFSYFISHVCSCFEPKLRLAKLTHTHTQINYIGRCKKQTFSVCCCCLLLYVSLSDSRVHAPALTLRKVCVRARVQCIFYVNVNGSMYRKHLYV